MLDKDARIVITSNGKIVYYENRTVYYNKDNKLHREDGPARDFKDGRKCFYLDGKELKDIKSTEELIIKLIIE